MQTDEAAPLLYPAGRAGEGLKLIDVNRTQAAGLSTLQHFSLFSINPALLQRALRQRIQPGKGKVLLRLFAQPVMNHFEVIHDRLCKQTKQHLSFTRLDALAKRALEQGWIDAKEAEVLQRAEASRLRSINVDEFEAFASASSRVKERCCFVCLHSLSWITSAAITSCNACSS